MENVIPTPRKLLRPRPNPMSRRTRWSALRRTSPLACAAFLMLWTFASPKLLQAQAAAAPETAQKAKPAAQSTTAHATSRHTTAHRRAAVRRAALHPGKPAAGGSAAPPKPNWPAEQPANPAQVTWDSQGLAIQASNSSLEQILHDVSAETGVKLEGLNQDERIFGNYGPGPAREVLSRLLDGSGYNVLMIGGGGDEPPQQIILSPSAAGGAQPAKAQTKNAEEGDADEQSQEPDTPLPMPLRNPMGASVPPDRSPQEIQQEMLIREQQIEQQREQQQQANPQF